MMFFQRIHILCKLQILREENDVKRTNVIYIVILVAKKCSHSVQQIFLNKYSRATA